MFQTQALIIDTQNPASGYYLFTVLAPEIAVAAKPGQFIQVNTGSLEVNDPLLPRPISLFSRNEAAGTVSFIFKTVGRGTRILAEEKKGALLNIRGPIGNGFSVNENARNIVLIAGGIGMPPLFFLAEHLLRTKPQTKITLFYGGRTGSDLLKLGCLRKLGVEVFCATDDGSFGYRGVITDFISKKYLEYIRTEADFIAACGPRLLLKAVQDITADIQIPCQLSLEAYMACGVGACLGCACETNQGRRRVCVDGPVFSAKEVVL